jgi:hypothetical protein
MSKNRRGARFFSMPLNPSIARAVSLSYVDNKLENIVISPKRCHILARFEHLAYDNKEPVNNIVIKLKASMFDICVSTDAT